MKKWILWTGLLAGLQLCVLLFFLFVAKNSFLACCLPISETQASPSASEGLPESKPTRQEEDRKESFPIPMPPQARYFIDKKIQSMSLPEKVGQLIHIGMSGKEARGRVLSDIRRFHPGGVILFAANFGNAESVRKLTQGLRKASLEKNGIPVFLSTDQEGGRVFRIGADGTEQFPGAMALGQADDPMLAREAGFVTGYELRELGIPLIFAPVLDINNNPRNPVIQTRSFGSDQKRVIRIALPFLKGMQSSLAVPVIKHFPGHGDTQVDSHLDLPVIRRSLAELEARELVPFQKAIQDTKAAALMSAHILYPKIDPEYPATLSKKIITGLLRQKMGYTGLVISDAMEMKAIAKRYGQGEAAVLAFRAGVDVILLTSTGEILQKMHTALLQAFREGRIPKSRLNESLRRQLYLKLEHGLFPGERLQKESPGLWELMQIDERRAAARLALMHIRAKYKKKGLSLNRLLSRKSIRSLGKDFQGISKKRKRKLLYYKTGILLDEAKQSGVSTLRLRRRSQLYSVLRIPETQARETIVFVELSSRELPAWNRLVNILNKSVQSGLPAPMLVGLYTGSPFATIRIPEHGAVLASFSPTAESRRALLYRALKGPVAKASLLLTQ